MNLLPGIRRLTKSSFGMLVGLLCIVTSPLAFAQSVDLAIQGTSISPTWVVAGNQVTATGSVSNSASASASTSNIGYYLSRDNVLDHADNLIGYSHGSSLSGGTSSPRSVSLTIPAGTAPGSYYIIFVADYLNELTEGNENNNASPVAITVAAPAVDLHFRFASSPISMAAGSTVPFSANIVCQGNTAAASAYVGTYLSIDNTVDASDILMGTAGLREALAAGAARDVTGTFTVPLHTPPGSYWVLHKVDYGDLVAESNEENNLSRIAVTITAPTRDLFFRPAYVSPNPVTAGSSITADAAVINGGTAPANVVVRYYLSRDNVLDTLGTAADVALGDYTSATALNGGNAGISTSQILTIPAATAGGRYYVIALLDPSQTVSETAETNNLTSAPLTVLSGTLADLTFSTIPTASPTTVAVGERMDYITNILNVGTVSISGATTGYFLSADSILDASDVLLFNRYFAEQGGGSAGGFVLPPNTKPGSYYLLYVIDYHQDIAEGDENNNIYRIAITVVPAVAPAPLPDLFIARASVSSSIKSAGDTLVADLVVSNSGTAAAGASYVGWYLSKNGDIDSADILLSQSFVDSLAAGSESAHPATNLIIPANLSPGSYWLLLKANHSASVTERSEENNEWGIYLSITGTGQDLRSEDIRFTEVLRAGTTISASVNVANYGALPAASSQVHFYLSADNSVGPADILLGSSPVAPLAGNQRASITMPLTIPAATTPGKFYLVAVADPENTVAETLEYNNTTFTTFSVGDIDLSVVAGSPALLLDVTTNTPIPAGTATVEVDHEVETFFIIRNSGTASSNLTRFSSFLSSDSMYSADDVVLGGGSGFILALNTGDSFRYPIIRIPATTPSGTYYVLFKVDHENKLAETDETNNIQALAITITGGPMADLGLQAPATNPAAAPPGGKVTLVATLTNTGQTPARASTLRYYLSADATVDSTDVVLASTATAALAISDTLALSREVMLPASTAAGSYHILLVADADSTVPEENEGNNMLAVTFTVNTPPLPDATIAPAAAPAVAPTLPGATVTTALTLKNQGTAPLSADTISFYLSANNTYEATDVQVGSSPVPALAPGAETQLSVALNIPAQTAPGPYHLLAVADQAGSVTESDENNNWYAFALTVAVPTPDLALQNPALSAATVARGSALTATATLANVGAAPALAGEVRYYLSTNNTWESSDVLLGESQMPALEASATSALSAALTIPAATTTGDYFVLLVADATGGNAESNEANNLGAVALAVSVANGIKDLQASYTIRVAPNPAPEQVHLSVDNAPRGVKGAVVTLYDITGSKVLAGQAPMAGNALNARLDVRHLSQGTYLLHIRIGNEVVIRKIVIAR